MQIRKPLMKSALVDQNLTEEEVNMKFVQDLLRWVDEMQVASICAVLSFHIITLLNVCEGSELILNFSL